jgi:hypothetical protein
VGHRCVHSGASGKLEVGDLSALDDLWTSRASSLEQALLHSALGEVVNDSRLPSAPTSSLDGSRPTPRFASDIASNTPYATAMSRCGTAPSSTSAGRAFAATSMSASLSQAKARDHLDASVAKSRGPGPCRIARGWRSTMSWNTYESGPRRRQGLNHGRRHTRFICGFSTGCSMSPIARSA